MNNDFVKNALSWGDDGKKWLEEIPNIIAQYEKKWDFVAEPPFNLNYNYVAPVVLKNGSKAVLKIGFPKDSEFQTEIKTLAIFNGDGAVKLLEVDEKNSVILIERVFPGKPLSALEDDDTASVILTNVIKKLRKSAFVNRNEFPNISDLAKAIPKFKKKYEHVPSPIPMFLVEKAESLFTYLISSSTEQILIHGDLHHDNILLSGNENWIAIDPKGIIAEPIFEVAAAIRNPYEKLKNIVNLKPLLKKRIKIFAKELDCHPKRICQWCFCQTVLSAVWSSGEGAKTPDHAVRVAKILFELIDDFE